MLYKNFIISLISLFSIFNVKGQTIYDVSSDTSAVDEILYERSVSFHVANIDSFDVVFEHFMIEEGDTISLFVNDFNLIDQDFDGFKEFNFNNETNLFEFTLGAFNHMPYLTTLKLIQNGVIIEEYALE